MDIKEFITGYRGKDIPKEMNDFNWGAFLLTFIWGIKYKAWVTFLAIPLIFIKLPLYSNFLLFFLFQLYCGTKGNMWAYQIEYWKSPAHFRKTQEKWGMLAVTFGILVPVITISILIDFAAKHPAQAVEILQKL